ncbi:YuzD family protein [Thalassobacillus pellis]|uniref:YuzD family protein n=1 Tax=Thalassobacillus pellis TaxID=748008 RepID=UPI0019610955|nr:YuzD family protein [Thalassobacillus pellis]MBM7554877.1 disulfide oxidoreductase YuzD [Thalassobacillus pellis]
MESKPVRLVVYGADQICPSCINSPGSKETYEWLQAAISRKYGEGSIIYEYVDIFNPPEDERHQEYVQRILDEELFYPLVVVNDTIVGEGNPRLKTVYNSLEERGLEGKK